MSIFRSLAVSAFTVLFAFSASAHAEFVPYGGIFGGDGQDPSTRNDYNIPYIYNYGTCNHELRVGYDSNEFSSISSYSYLKLPYSSYNRSSDRSRAGARFSWNDNNIFLISTFTVPSNQLGLLSDAVTDDSSQTLRQLKNKYSTSLECEVSLVWYRPQPGQSWIRRHHFQCEYTTGVRSNNTFSTGTYYGKFKNRVARVYQDCK
jgi:hypothetical protein